MLSDGVWLSEFMSAMITQVFYVKYLDVYAYALMWCLHWLNRPSMLLLLLVFLLRAGKLPSGKHNNTKLT